MRRCPYRCINNRRNKTVLLLSFSFYFTVELNRTAGHFAGTESHEDTWLREADALKLPGGGLLALDAGFALAADNRGRKARDGARRHGPFVTVRGDDDPRRPHFESFSKNVDDFGGLDLDSRTTNCRPSVSLHGAANSCRQPLNCRTRWCSNHRRRGG